MPVEFIQNTDVSPGVRSAAQATVTCAVRGAPAPPAPAWRSHLAPSRGLLLPPPRGSCELWGPPSKSELRSAAAPWLLDLTDLTFVADDPDTSRLGSHRRRCWPWGLCVVSADRPKFTAVAGPRRAPVTGCRVNHCLVTPAWPGRWMRKHTKGQTVGVCLDALFWIPHSAFL